MRPVYNLALIMVLLICCSLFLHHSYINSRVEAASHIEAMHSLVATLGLSDLAVTTEARYTRHPAVSDDLVPFMDHPGALEHFPSGSFFAPAALK